MDTKTCFKCKCELSLDNFDIDRRKYQLPTDKGTCKVCKTCELEKALKELSAIRYNFGIEKFEVIHFKSKKEVLTYFMVL